MASDAKNGCVHEYLEECLSRGGLSPDDATRRYGEPGFPEFLRGEKSVPLNAVARVARSVGGDAMELFICCVAEYLPETYAAIEPRLKMSLTSDEATLIRNMRAWVGSAYLAALSDAQTAKLMDYLRALREPAGATRTLH